MKDFRKFVDVNLLSAFLAHNGLIFLVDLYYLLLQPDSYNDEIQPKKRLEDVIHLAELCIEVLQQNEEHHAEVIISLCLFVYVEA